MFKNDLNPFVCCMDNDYAIDRFSGGGQDDIAKGDYQVSMLIFPPRPHPLISHYTPK